MTDHIISISTANTLIKFQIYFFRLYCKYAHTHMWYHLTHLWYYINFWSHDCILVGPLMKKYTLPGHIFNILLIIFSVISSCLGAFCFISLNIWTSQEIDFSRLTHLSLTHKRRLETPTLHSGSQTLECKDLRGLLNYNFLSPDLNFLKNFRVKVSF